MQHSKEQGRRPTLRHGDDGNLADAKMVEEMGIGVGLIVARGLRGRCRAQVPKARWGDGVKPVAEHSLRNELALVVSASTAVDDEDVRSRAPFCVFDVPIGGRDNASRGANPSIGPLHVAARRHQAERQGGE